MADATKLDGYAVLGASNAAATSTKLDSYSVLGPSDSEVTATKASAYAVLGAADVFESVSKLTCYAVIQVPRQILTGGNTEVTDQFKIIRPTAINDSRLTSSTVPEADHSIWSIGPTFGVGNRYMMTTGVHTIYECLVAHTSTVASDAPNLNLTGLSPKWLKVGATNRWAMFDGKVGSATTATDSLTVVLTTGRINSLAVLQVDAAAVDVDLTVGGVVVYSATMDLTAGTQVGDWYQYFYEPVYQQDTVVITNLVDAALLALPSYTEGVLTVTLRRTGGTVSCGLLVVGIFAEIGVTQYQPQVGIVDYSRKERNAFGVADILLRDYSKRMSAVTIVDKAAVDQVTRTLAQYRSTNLVWVGAGNLYTCMIIYGFYKDWDMVIDNYVHSRLSLQVEGLI